MAIEDEFPEDIEPLRRRNGNQHMHRESLDYRNDVKRKINAYHVFVQTGLIAQGLLRHLAAVFPQLVWNSHTSVGEKTYVRRVFAQMRR